MYSTRTFLFLKNKGFTREELLTILRGLGGEDNIRMDSTRRELRTLLRTLPQEKRLASSTRQFLRELLSRQLRALSTVFLAYDHTQTWLPFESLALCAGSVMTSADLYLVAEIFSTSVLALSVEQNASLHVSYLDAADGKAEDFCWHTERGRESTAPPFFLSEICSAAGREAIGQLWHDKNVHEAKNKLDALARLLRLPVFLSFPEEAEKSGYMLLTPLD